MAKFVLKYYLDFRDDDGKDIPVRELNERDSKDAALIRKLQADKDYMNSKF